MMVVEEASSVKEEEETNLAELEKKMEALSDNVQVIISRLEVAEPKMHDVSKFSLNVMRCSTTTLCLMQERTTKGKGKEDKDYKALFKLLTKEWARKLLLKKSHGKKK